MREFEYQYARNRDVWQDYNARQEFEHDLINRKTTWWMTAQTILFAAYGVTLRGDLTNSLLTDADTFRNAITIVGLAAASVTFIGVAAVVVSKVLSWRVYAKSYQLREYRLPGPLNKKRLAWGVNTVNTWFTLTPDLLLPVIFAVAWLYLLIWM